ncbi:MAG: YdeI/OmpD-associated family protein, partial [Ignavibacterium sp.]
SIDENSYMIRFTPRNPKSNWSAINIKKIKELTKLGLMHPTGIEAYKKREEKRSEVYSFEQMKVKLDKKYEKKLKSNKQAWKFFQSLPPSTKKQSIWWVMSAKKEETQLRRLDILINSSEEGKKIPPLNISKKGK